MKKMRTLLGLALAVGAALSMTAPAFASDYSFATTAPQDYYGSTSYEDVYGAQYNYGGRNAADYDVPELEYGRMTTTQTGIMERTILPGLQGAVVDDSGSYGIGDEGSSPLTKHHAHYTHRPAAHLHQRARHGTGGWQHRHPVHPKAGHQREGVGG